MSTGPPEGAHADRPAAAQRPPGNPDSARAEHDELPASAPAEPGPGKVAAGPAQETTDAGPRRKKTQQRRVRRDDVNAYAADRDRVYRDSVIFKNCWISAGTFVARDAGGTSARKLRIGQVRGQLLSKLGDVYVAPDRAAAAAKNLLRERLVCLRGAAGSGRETLAMCLLRKQVGDDVWQISPHTPLAEISEAGLGPPRGYFLVLDANDPCSEFELDRLRATCEQAKCFVILIASLGRPELPSALPVVTVQPPSVPRVEVLRRHVIRPLTPRERATAERLLASPDVTRWCEAPRSMAELDRVASVLADTARGSIDEADLPIHLELAVADRMRSWFDNPDAKPLRSLKATLSFFGGLPVHTVLDLETHLSELIREAEKDTSPRELFEASLESRLHDASAAVRTRDYQYEHGAERTQVAEFADRTLENRLATLLRTGYPGVRPVLIDWLLKAAEHADQQVQFRAAMAIGGFIQDGQPMLLKQVIEPWAARPDVQSALRVVCALTGPLQSGETERGVSRALEQWIDFADPDMVFAAAMVYGLAVAPQDAQSAVMGLERIAQIDAPDHADWRMAAAATGVMGMFLSGLVAEVLAALRRWTLSEKQPAAVELARSAFLTIADLVEEERERPRPAIAEGNGEATGDATGAGTQTWPSLLAAAVQQATRPDTVALWRSALNDAAWSPVALAILEDWFKRADERRYLVEPLANLLGALSVETRREAERIAYYLEAWASKDPAGAAASCRSLLLDRARRVDPPAGNAAASRAEPAGPAQ